MADLDTYRKLYSMHIPEIAVRQKMSGAGMSEEEIDAFFVAVHAKESGAPPPPPPGGGQPVANDTAPPPPPAGSSGAAESAPPPPPKPASPAAVTAPAQNGTGESLEDLVAKQIINIQEKLIPEIEKYTTSSTAELSKMSPDQIQAVIDLAQRCDPWSIFELESYASSNAEVVVATVLNWLPYDAPRASQVREKPTKPGNWTWFLDKIQSKLTTGQKTELVECIVECKLLLRAPPP
jgi:hypothetical protein